MTILNRARLHNWSDIIISAILSQLIINQRLILPIKIFKKRNYLSTHFTDSRYKIYFLKLKTSGSEFLRKIDIFLESLKCSEEWVKYI